MRGAFGAWLQLHELKREASGLFSRATQTNRLSLHLPAAIDLERLLNEMSWPSAPQGPRRVEWAQLYVDCELGHIFGRIPVLEIETDVLEVGLRLRFSGATEALVTPGRPGEPGRLEPLLADSRVDAEVIVPWEFLALQGSPLANLGNQFRNNERSDTHFDFDRPGLAGLAIDRGSGRPFFRGRFAVEKGQRSFSCVVAQITDKMLVLNPANRPLMLSDGFAGEMSFGPTLTLFGLGHEAWARALNGEPAGRIELRGDGVGYLTEASSMGRVADRHTIAACCLELTLDDVELVLTITGEVDRLLQHAGPPLPPKLGPRFDVSVRIPVVFLAALGIDLLRWGAEQKWALDAGSTPN